MVKRRNGYTEQGTSTGVSRKSPPFVSPLVDWLVSSLNGAPFHTSISALVLTSRLVPGDNDSRRWGNYRGGTVSPHASTHVHTHSDSWLHCVYVFISHQELKLTSVANHARKSLQESVSSNYQNILPATNDILVLKIFAFGPLLTSLGFASFRKMVCASSHYVDQVSNPQMSQQRKKRFKCWR